MLGRPVATIDLSDAERTELEALSRRRKTGRATAMRARIVLRCAAGQSNKSGAVALGVTPKAGGKWRKRFAEMRLGRFLLQWDDDDQEKTAQESESGAISLQPDGTV